MILLWPILVDVARHVLPLAIAVLLGITAGLVAGAVLAGGLLVLFKLCGWLLIPPGVPFPR